MNDEKLLQYYLSLSDPEAGPWNLSPQNLYVEMMSRDFIQRNMEWFPGISVCNIGIGAGEWDDYLGYLCSGKGKVTSVDIDPDICSIFRYRQARLGHPNPSDVICENILSTRLQAGSFDVVTMIGSTMNEIGNYEQTLEACFNLLKSNGTFFYMDMVKYNDLKKFEDWARHNKVIVEQVEIFDRYANLSSFMLKARKQVE